MSETERDLPCAGRKGIFYSVGCKFVDDQPKRHGVFGRHGKRLGLDTNMDCWRITEQAFAERFGDAFQILSDLDRTKSRRSRYKVIELRDRADPRFHRLIALHARFGRVAQLEMHENRYNLQAVLNRKGVGGGKRV